MPASLLLLSLSLSPDTKAKVNAFVNYFNVNLSRRVRSESVTLSVGVKYVLSQYVSSARGRGHRVSLSTGEGGERGGEVRDDCCERGREKIALRRTVE